jgi:hypothetical protein
MVILKREDQIFPWLTAQEEIIGKMRGRVGGAGGARRDGVQLE